MVCMKYQVYITKQGRGWGKIPIICCLWTKNQCKVWGENIPFQPSSEKLVLKCVFKYNTWSIWKSRYAKMYFLPLKCFFSPCPVVCPRCSPPVHLFLMLSSSELRRIIKYGVITWTHNMNEKLFSMNRIRNIWTVVQIICQGDKLASHRFFMVFCIRRDFFSSLLIALNTTSQATQLRVYSSIYLLQVWQIQALNHG